MDNDKFKFTSCRPIGTDLERALSGKHHNGPVCENWVKGICGVTSVKVGRLQRILRSERGTEKCEELK